MMRRLWRGGRGDGDREGFEGPAGDISESIGLGRKGDPGLSLPMSVLEVRHLMWMTSAE